jgi:hypothetical protein
MTRLLARRDSRGLDCENAATKAEHITMKVAERIPMRIRFVRSIRVSLFSIGSVWSAMFRSLQAGPRDHLTDPPLDSRESGS